MQIDLEYINNESDPSKIWKYIKINNIPITYKKYLSGEGESGGWKHYAYISYLNNKEIAQSEDSWRTVLIKALLAYK